MKHREKPVVGQIVFSLNIGNAVRNRTQELTECVVTKVGRKYFSVCPKGWRTGSEYHISSWAEKTNYSADSYLYPTEQEYYDEVEEGVICKKIGEYFSYGRNLKKVPLEILREISNLVDKGSASV